MNWYALHCHSNYEGRVEGQLQRVAVEPFWPTVKHTVFKGWKGRERVVRKSLLPGYVFARFDALHRVPVISIPGIVRIVGYGDHQPAPIPDVEIESLKILMECGGPVEVEYLPQPGDSISISCGPLAGCEGFVTTLRGKCRVRVNVSLLNRAVSAEVDAAWLKPVPGKSLNTSNPATR